MLCILLGCNFFCWGLYEFIKIFPQEKFVLGKAQGTIGAVCFIFGSLLYPQNFSDLDKQQSSNHTNMLQLITSLHHPKEKDTKKTIRSNSCDLISWKGEFVSIYVKIQHGTYYPSLISQEKKKTQRFFFVFFVWISKSKWKNVIYNNSMTLTLVVRGVKRKESITIRATFEDKIL